MTAEIDAYIASQPPEVAAKLRAIRSTIAAAAPRATEKISYGMPTFALHGNLVHFAAFTHHIGFYPAPSGVAQFADELGAYKTSKGAVQLPLDEDIPHELIARIVRFRVEENEAREAERIAKQAAKRKQR